MDNIEEKLRKLLRLTSSPNQHEAALALQKAQELAMKYGYTLEELNTASSDTVLDVEVDDERGTTGVSNTSSILANCLAGFFRVKVYISTNYQTKAQVIKAIGLPKDVTSFTLAFQFTVNSFETLWKIYNKENPSTQARRVRNDYLLGFRDGCRDRLTDASQEYGIMIVTPNAVMKVYNDKFPVRRTNARPKYRTIAKAGDSSARNAGHRDGRTLSGKTIQGGN